MRIALVALEDEEAGNEQRELNSRQALAIAIRMRDGGSLAPLLLASAHSGLARRARDFGIPLLEIKKSFDAIALFKLWRWQKKHKFLLVLAMGGASLALGSRLLGMRKKGSAELDICLFLKPLPPQKKFLKRFCQAAHCICGSSFVAERMRETASCQTGPEFVISPPGMSMENFNFSAPSYDKKDRAAKKHFVFGMAGSLEPRSGALLVARAMSAMWQKTDLPPWETRMFGSGPRFGEVLEEAENLGVASRLSILSNQPLAEVSRYCHAWLAPGASPDELPETLWCGFAAGLPVIYAKSDLHKERMKLAPAGAALAVDMANPQELAKAMIAIASNSALRERLTERGSELVPHIGLEAMAERICSMLEEWGAKAASAQNSKITEEKQPDSDGNSQ